MTTDTLEKILNVYTTLTGRAAGFIAYEYDLGKYAMAGYTAENMETVIKFMLRENSRNTFKYSLRLDKLLHDLGRFDSLLGEASARMRNIKPTPTPQQKVLAQFRGVAETETSTTATPVMMAKDVAKAALAGLAKEL